MKRSLSNKEALSLMPNRPLLQTILFSLGVLALCSRASADVHVVEPSGLGDFQTIQAAVDIASDGDTILLRSGTHGTFTIADKSLNIVEDFGANARIEGAVTVTNLHSSRSVLFSGVTIQGGLLGQVGLTLQSNDGAVRFQSCELLGYDGVSHQAGSVSMVVTSCADVAFAASTIRGGHGDSNQTQCCASTGSGAIALVSTDSNIALYDCVVEGGEGGTTGEGAGDGATACDVTNGTLFASNCQILGGRGGDGFDFIFAIGGDGGDGLVTSGTAVASLLDTTVVAGPGGLADFVACCDGVAGTAFVGNSVLIVPGTSRTLAAPSIVRSIDDLDVTLSGEAGDVFFLNRSPRPDFVPVPLGVWLTPFPPHSSKPLAQLGGSGSAQITIPVGRLLPPVLIELGGGVRAYYLQGLIDTGQTLIPASPLHVFVVDCAAIGPDCNANSRFDSCDVLEGTSVDCQNNGVPDECEVDCDINGIPDFCDLETGNALDCNMNGVPDRCDPDCSGDGIPDDCEPDCNANSMPDPCDIQLGTSDDCDTNGVPDDCQEDCNSNMVLDTCDIAMGTSTDVNFNSIPDECEPAGQTWYVDVNATPGGNGTQAQPFQAIGDAVTVANTGQTIIVADGVYSGLANRNVDLTGLALDIQSVNGPGSTTIDCETLGRAFYVEDATPGLTSRVKGFTIINGLVNGAVQTPGFNGGAMYIDNSDTIVERCILQDNEASRGGALYILGSDAHVLDCNFVSNVGNGGEARSGRSAATRSSSRVSC